MSETLETILLIVIMAVLCVITWTPAQGQQPAKLHLPPADYDYPYKGKLTIETVTPEELRARCSVATFVSLGCAFVRADSCRILLVDDESMKTAGWTRELMLRHEIAHCNGWPPDHPGRRPWPITTQPTAPNNCKLNGQFFCR